MAYVASALARSDGWVAADLAPGTIEELVEELHELGSPALCLIDEDDEHLAVVRVDEDDDDPRTFVSDSRALTAGGLLERLLVDHIDGPVVAEADDKDDDEDDDEAETARPKVEPAGDPALLDDLGLPADRLLALCAGEGMLPSDVAYAVAEALGAAEELEEVRGL